MKIADDILNKIGIKPGDRIRVYRDDCVFEGIILPRTEYDDLDIIVLKLDNGYNIGVSINKVKKIEVIEKGSFKEAYEIQESPKDERGDIAFIGTGGTIASYVDYKTGAVHSKMTVEALLDTYKPLREMGKIRIRQAMSKFSENMTPNDWIKIAEYVKEEFNNGVKGVVVLHGTDTMSYTSAALSFLLDNLPGPVTLVGAQRSSDRPSTDAYLNVICASKVAKESDIGEVVVTMHATISDDYCYVHRGVKVRKMHSSRRDAFKSINVPPIAKVTPKKIEYLSEYRKASVGPIRLTGGFHENVGLIFYYPGLKADILSKLYDIFDGIVIAGTGLGHVHEDLIPIIKRATDEGKPTVITTQCLYGRVNLFVYSTGRRLLKAGVIPGEDMLPEVAYVKLMWVMNKTRDLEKIRELMLMNFRGEISERRVAHELP